MKYHYVTDDGHEGDVEEKEGHTSETGLVWHLLHLVHEQIKEKENAELSSMRKFKQSK